MRTRRRPANSLENTHSSQNCLGAGLLPWKDLGSREQSKRCMRYQECQSLCSLCRMKLDKSLLTAVSLSGSQHIWRECSMLFASADMPLPFRVRGHILQ